MAKLRVKAPDGKTLVIAIPAGTDPSQYPAMAQAAVAHYAQNSQRYTPTGFPEPQTSDNPAAGEEKPIEQKLVENTINAGNGVGMGYGLPAMAQGIGKLGMKAAGAISKGMAPALEGLGDTIGSWIPNGWKGLPDNALKADTMVKDATHYAMNPHPEVQQAIMDISGGAPKAAAETAEDIVPESESTVKELSQPTLSAGEAPDELAASKDIGALEPESPVLEPEVMNPASDAHSPVGEPTEPAIPEEMGLFDRPIFSMDNMTPKAQLQHTEAQMQTVGQAIGDQLEKLNQSGKLFDPEKTAKQLESMYLRDFSGKIIPAGDNSEQAVNNAAVSHALETLKAEAQDSDGILHSIPWERANAAKGSLQRLAEGTGDPVTSQAARMIRDSIDDQAEKLLAEQGDNIAPFQQLRDAYGKLAQIHNTLNTQVRSGLGAKNQVPVVRGGAALAGTMTGNPGVAAAAATDFFGRKYGTLALARGLHNLSGAPEALSNAGEGAGSAMARGAKGIAAGLAGNDEEKQ